MELGYSFTWNAFSAPVLKFPNGSKIELEVVDYVPMVNSDTFAAKDTDGTRIERQFALALTRRRRSTTGGGDYDEFVAAQEAALAQYRGAVRMRPRLWSLPLL